MIFNLILGILAGIGSRYAEDPIGAFVKDKAEFDDRDLRVLAFVILLLAAAFLIWIAGADGKPIMLIVGGGIGIFGTALMKVGREQKAVFETKMQDRKATQNGETVVAEKPAAKPAAKKPAAKKPAAKK